MKFVASFLAVFFLMAFAQLDKTVITMKIGHLQIKEKTLITGKTNLPDGTKLGVSIYVDDKLASQDFEVYVANGSFVSDGLTNKGKSYKGKVLASVSITNNHIWQIEPVQQKLNDFVIPDNSLGIPSFSMLKELDL